MARNFLLSHQCTEENCRSMAYQLSTYDEPFGNSLDVRQPYTRTVKWKCGLGHITTTSYRIFIDRVTGKVVKE